MKYFIAACIILFILSCKNSSNPTSIKPDTNEVEQQEIISKPLNIDGCYIKVTGRDTLLIRFEKKNNEISGILRFDNFEKDSSYGTAKGTIENGLIIIWYDFQSEGMQSHVQYVFKPVENGLLWGISELDYQNDSAHLKDYNSIQFPEENFLGKIECEQINKQLNKYQ